MNKTGRKLFSLELPHPQLLSQLSSRRHSHQHRPHSKLWGLNTLWNVSFLFHFSESSLLWARRQLEYNLRLPKICCSVRLSDCLLIKLISQKMPGSPNLSTGYMCIWINFVSKSMCCNIVATLPHLLPAEYKLTLRKLFETRQTTETQQTTKHKKHY